jgi:hypothetical protein
VCMWGGGQRRGAVFLRDARVLHVNVGSWPYCEDVLPGFRCDIFN